MYDHGFRLDQDEAIKESYYEPEVRHMSLWWVFCNLVFPHCESDDGVIMTCTRKWHFIELSYLFYPGVEIIYVGLFGKEVYRKERNVPRDQGLPEDIPY